MNDVSTPEALELLTEVSGVTDIGPATPFGSLSVDSLTLIEWVTLLGEKMDAEFNLRDLNVADLSDLSAGDVVDVLRQRVATSMT